MGEKPEAAEGQFPQSAPSATVKPGLSTQYILVLAGTSDFRADSVAAWLQVHGQSSASSLQCHFIHYNFDESIDVLVLLDLMERVRAHVFYGGVARNLVLCHAHRDRTMADSVSFKTIGLNDRLQHSNRVLEASWWFPAVALTGQPKLVKMVLVFPEDFGGEQEAGPTSILALEGFHSLQGEGEARRGAAFFCKFAGAEHRRPMGVITNLSALDQFLYAGWPNLKAHQGKLSYYGPLPRSSL